MTLQMYTFSAFDWTMASTILSMSKFGMMLVYREPGPNTIALALWIASNPSADREHFAGGSHGLLEIPRDLCHRRNEEVPEAVALQGRVLGETVLKEPLHERFGIGQRHQAVADIAGRDHVELLAQAPRAAAVVRHGDDRRAVGRVLFQALQGGREARAAADGHDPRPLLQVPPLKDQLDEVLTVSRDDHFQQ